MSTFNCDNCFNTFDGHGIYKSYNCTLCHQCAIIKQQEKQYEEQCKREEERERQRRAEESRRHWEDYEHQNTQRSAYNNVSRGIDLSNPEHFEKVFELFVQKLEKNLGVGQTNTDTVIPQNNNFNKFANNTAHIEKKSHQPPRSYHNKKIQKIKELYNLSSLGPDFSKLTVVEYNSIIGELVSLVDARNVDVFTVEQSVFNQLVQEFIGTYGTVSKAEQNYQTFLDEGKKQDKGLSIIHFLLVVALGALGVYLLEYIILVVIILILVLPPILSLLGIFLFKK